MQEKKIEQVAENPCDNLNEEIERIIDMAVERAIAKVMEKAEADRPVVLSGAVSGETGRETPDKRVDFSKLSYCELCAFLENHPKAKLHSRLT
jgi:hypothetical protein